MKLTDDNEPSMWERIAQKPAKKAPVIRGPKPSIRSTKVEDHADALLNLALKGILNSDGGWKF